MCSNNTNQAKGQLKTIRWEEKTWDGKNWDEVSGRRVTHADVSVEFEGGIEGSGRQSYLMFYHDDNNVDFVGLEEIHGRVAGRSGSFIIQHKGTFQAGIVKSDWSVVPGSGTEALTGLVGEGTYLFEGEHGDPTQYTFSFDFV